MSDKFQCGDNPALVGYLYDECEPDERIAIAAHVAVCAACAAELAALESTRAHVASWAPPEADLGFQVVRGDVARSDAPRILTPSFASAPAPWWRQPIPAWAQAAAAVLIFAAGVSIGIARDGAIGGEARMAAQAPQAASAVQPAPAAAAPAAVSAQDLAALEERLRAEITQAQAAGAAAPAPRLVAAGGVSSDDLQALEQRLQSEMALRMTQMAREFEMQRRVDLARIGQELGPFNAEIMRQRQELNTVNNLIRTSLQGR
jgi:hypothetical protein